MTEDIYKYKYLIYKQKYLNLQKLENKLMNGGKRVSESVPELYLFKADWCGHCKNFKPTWANLKSNYNKVKYNEFDADKDHNIIKKFNISGYPTIMLKHNNKMIEYNGNRDKDSILEFIQVYTK